MLDIKHLIEKYGLNEDELTKALSSIKNKDSILFTMSGKMGAGKDTIGDLISSALEDQGYQLINISFGQLIREEIDSLVNEFNDTDDKDAYSASVNANKDDLIKLSSLLKDCSIFDRTYKAREALQFWGTEVRRKQGSNYWINKMSSFVVDKINKGYSVNITDARFPNEIQLVEDLLGKAVRIDVPAAVRVKRIELRDNIKVNLDTLQHTSETALDGYKFKLILDGTETPSQLAKEGLNYIEGKSC